MKLPTRFARTALPWWCLVTMLATAAAMVRAMQGPPSEFDEGFIVTGALQMLHGGLPIRDFFVIYGPGQYSLTAAVFALFGETIFNARVLHVVVLALLGATLVALAGVLTDAANQRRWPWLALVALGYVLMTAHVLPGPGYAALPATLLLLWASLAVAAATAQAAAGQWGAGRLLKASVLLGLAGVMRWDFGVYGLLAAGATMLMSSAAQGRSRGEILRALALTAGPALAILLLVFTPLIVLGGAARWWDEVPRFHLLEFKVWRNLDFFTPALTDAWAALQAHDRWALSRAVLKLVYAALPMSVGSVVALLAGRQLWQRVRGQPDAAAAHPTRHGMPGWASARARAPALALMLALLTMLLFNQMRVRSHWQQGFPAYVVALPVLAYALATWWAAAQAWVPWRRLVAAAVPVFMAGAVLVLPLDVLQGDHRKRLPATPAAQQLPRAGYTVHLESEADRQRWADYVALVQHLRSSTAPGEPIFSGVADTSRLFINDAMLYFLTDRPPATRWVEMEPGLANSERGQRELILALQVRGVHKVVAWNMGSNGERNATAITNGIHLLDAYLRTRCQPEREFGRYTVLNCRATGA